MEYMIELASAPSGVLENSHALRLCSQAHKRNYVLKKIMCLLEMGMLQNPHSQ
jgi:hypothetical protein